jgi:hypothetical protein
MGTVDAVKLWIERVVVGLDLCPFARAPLDSGRIRIVESRASDFEEILAEVINEIHLLAAPESESDTTLLTIPALDTDFDAFLDLIGMAEATLEATHFHTHFQLAHFHPQYVFDGVESDDETNHTNRSPHAVLHILRWSDVRYAMETHPDVGRIPSRNQALLRAIGVDGIPSLDGPNPRDFRRELAPYKCWDRQTQRQFEAHNEALEDCILQNREEVIGLAEFIEAHAIRSYLEVGIWTGRLVTALHTIFDFDTVATADQGYAKTCGLPIHLPPDVQAFWGQSESTHYSDWRANLGLIDLVLIDANHSYEAVKRDFEINRQFPHRFLAFHDITGANRWTTGVKRFWDELNEGHKVEICRPHTELGLDHSIMGIGIWSEMLP